MQHYEEYYQFYNVNNEDYSTWVGCKALVTCKFLITIAAICIQYDHEETFWQDIVESGKS